jgi:phosphoglycerate dehydrogenase-like enzyme
LANEVSVFQPSERQLAWLAARLKRDCVVPVGSDAELLAALPEVDAAVVWRFEREWYSRSTRLRQVLTPAAGRESVALDPTGRAAVHYGTFHGQIMAESLLAMVLFMNRRLGHAVHAQRRSAWERRPYQTTRSLCGQIALLVGYGNIGGHVARLLRSVGMIVHGLKRDLTRGTEGLDQVFGARQLLAAVAHANHIVCILPGDTGTDNLLGRAAFERMQPQACVYNLGRGNAIDGDALLWALKHGRIAGAYLDVVPEEPLPPGSPLWSAPNLHLTPHASAIRDDYLDLYFAELARKLEAVR